MKISFNIKSNTGALRKKNHSLVDVNAALHQKGLNFYFTYFFQYFIMYF